MRVFGRSFQPLLIVLELIAVLLILVPYSPQNTVVKAQDAGFEIPVQLIGFPVIVMAVRTSNFVRKLAYALNPSTYRRSIRTIRGADLEPQLVLDKADQILVKQLGSNYCIYKDVCLDNVKSAKSHIDWTDIINRYTNLSADKQQYYLMSVFLGNIIRSEKLCQYFHEAGRTCR